MSSVHGARSVGAITWKPRAPAAYEPSPWMLILRSAGILLPARPRRSTHGPHRSSLFTLRVSTTRAPSRSSLALSRSDTRHANVASG